MGIYCPCNLFSIMKMESILLNPCVKQFTDLSPLSSTLAATCLSYSPVVNVLLCRWCLLKLYFHLKLKEFTKLIWEFIMIECLSISRVL